jgi:hypothetical protein
MGARELLHELTDAGFSIEAADDKLVIRPASKLTNDLRAALRQAKPELLAMLASPLRPYRLTAGEADAAHAEPWDDADCGRFVARVSLFLRRGINATDADDLAERLHLRDLRGDDHAICLECAHLAGLRCGNADAAGPRPDLPAEKVMKLWNCPVFAREELQP